jgi:hypothetical protein
MREHFVHRGRLGAVGPRVGAHRPALGIDFERERVDERAIAIGIEDRDAVRELLGHPFVVVVEERDVLAGRRANAGVARCGEAAIALRDDADSIAEAREHRGGVVGRAIVDDDHLVVGVGLREHAGQRALDGRRAVVYCDDYRDARIASVGHRLRLFHRQCAESFAARASEKMFLSICDTRSATPVRSG